MSDQTAIERLETRVRTGMLLSPVADDVRAVLAEVARLHSELRAMTARADEEGGAMTALKLVHHQAADAGLWFIARYATEEYLQRALRELHSAVEQDIEARGSSVTSWQAIETAPKDGTPFVAANRFDAFRAFYDTGEEVWIAEESGQWFGQLRVPPTHWMPLPPVDAGGNTRLDSSTGRVNVQRSPTTEGRHDDVGAGSSPVPVANTASRPGVSTTNIDQQMSPA